MSEGQVDVLLGVFYSTMALALLFAWWKGGAPEQAGALLIFVSSLTQWVLSETLLQPRYASIDLLPLAIDLLGLVGFAWIGFFAKRYWPLWASALQLLSVAGHFVRALDPAMAPWAYSLMKTTPTYFIFVTLIVGTALQWRRSHSTRPRHYLKG